MTSIIIPPLSPFPGRGAAPEDYIAKADTVMQELPGVIAAMNEMSAAFNLGAAVLDSGYLPPILYTAGIVLTTVIQTVEYNGAIYAPLISTLPFTTSGVFEAANFRVIQGVTQEDLEDAGGDLVSVGGITLTTALAGLATPVEKFGALPASQADSSGAFLAASTSGKEVVCNGTYRLDTLPDSMDWRNFSGSGTATIKGKLFTFAYIKKPKFSFDEIRGRIAFTHPGDFEVKLAFYGDSIVDGANTVSAVNNPVDAQGRAIGTSNHTLTNAGAFSNRLLGLFQELSATFGKPNRVRVWNAGYSGKSAITGWANENYERAVILNPQYGSPDAVGIEFSINDSYANGPSTANSPNLYAVEMKKLMAKIQGYGAVPFMITPPQIFAVAGYDSRIISGVYDQIKKGLASAVPGVAYLDMGAAVARWYNAGMDGNGPSDPPLSAGYRTASQFYQTAQAGAADRTHSADRSHRFMAGYLYAQLAPNMLVTSRDRYESISSADYRWRLNVIDSGAGTSVAVPKLSQHGGNVVALAGQYTGGQQWNTAWIWNDQPDAYLVYRAGDVNGSKSGQPYVATAEAGTLTVIDKCGGLFSYQERLPNDGVAPFVPAPTCDRPHVICQLAHGLNFVSLTAPTSNTYDYFPGALEVSVGLTQGYGAGTWTDYVATRNLLSECGPIYKTQTTGGRVYGVEESLGGANWVDFGRAGKTTSLLLEMEISGTGSIGITCGAGGSHRRVNGALYRDNATQLKLVLFTEAFDGTSNTYLIQAFDYLKTGLQRIRLDLGRDATGNQLIRLYDGWSDATPIGEWISSNGASPTICWPWAGHFGDHTLQGATTLECRYATVTMR